MYNHSNRQFDDTVRSDRCVSDSVHSVLYLTFACIIIVSMSVLGKKIKNRIKIK